MLLPKVLAGPILRRASSELVCVWLATSIQLTKAELQLFSHSKRTGKPVRNTIKLPAHTQWIQVSAGKNLYIHLLLCTTKDSRSLQASETARSSPPPTLQPIGSVLNFPTGEILAYDISWESAQQPGKNFLKDLVDLKEFVYKPYDLPTCVLQPINSSRLNCLYGSCRKMHGHGIDAIEAGERTLARYATDPRRRPHILSLGGDQIYADEVSDVLIRPIQELGTKLFGKLEPLPGIKDPTKIRIGARSYIVKKKAQYSSDYARNHLMTFSEFAATYLMAWNPDLWPKHFAPNSRIWMDSDRSLRVAEIDEVLDAEKKRIRQARTGATYARRMLANVSTYMIFDDHEITDDWYLSVDWKKQVQNTPLGRRMLAIGISSYYLFQAIGNDPTNLPNDQLLLAINQYSLNPTGSGAAIEQAFLTFNNWSFRTSTKPSIVHTNTRTRRQQTPNRLHSKFMFESQGKIKTHVLPKDTPRLMNYRERSRLFGLIDAAVKDDNRLVIVAPTPVYGFSSLEQIQDFMTITVGKHGTAVDNEGFHADPNSFLDIIALTTQSKPKFVLFLSGDVHYGFTAQANVTLNGRSTKIAQFTSSATKNQVYGKERRVLTLLQHRFKLLAQKETSLWWRHSGGIGRTIRLGKPEFNNTELKRATEEIKRKYGDPYLVEESKLVNIDTWNTLEMTNNMGHLELIGQQIIHKLVKQTESGTHPKAGSSVHWVSGPP